MIRFNITLLKPELTIEPRQTYAIYLQQMHYRAMRDCVLF